MYDALKEKGYNPVNQLVGYILSEDPTYITTYKNARAMIRKVDLLPMGGRTIMLVLVTSNGVVRSRGCRLPEPVTPELIETFLCGYGAHLPWPPGGGDQPRAD